MFFFLSACILGSGLKTYFLFSVSYLASGSLWYFNFRFSSLTSLFEKLLLLLFLLRLYYLYV